MPDLPSPTEDAQALRRRRAHRTAWVVGGIAVLVYAGFILSGVIGR
ncbi:hypothetical protein [Stenotrophomonas tumulicola]|uniref:Uncharacterized protein n=1 Tax=Stenotrophomonas tumulicola TaxID=1685415 RepID=A0A7W3IK02_9GAMM|nr:hypothetical protein [Stenotrophomonas tumulicola]MBA8683826.1 hypothetical protein [Stenotrophomonas tumulicola]